jgi:DNA-directed RNA polymerase subunit M/transcription elongation factor TFIIS
MMFCPNDGTEIPLTEEIGGDPIYDCPKCGYTWVYNDQFAYECYKTRETALNSWGVTEADVVKVGGGEGRR